MRGRTECEFDRLADQYVACRRSLPGTRVYLDYLYRSIASCIGHTTEHGQFLDLMSGQGDLARVAEEQSGGAVVALDISTGMLAHNPCRRRVRADALHMPFGSGTFSGVVVCGGLHHLTEDVLPTALQEVRRVIRPGGVLAFFEPADDFIVARMLRRFFYARLEGLGDRDAEESIFFRPQLFRDLEAAGFSSVELHPFGGVAYGLLSQVDAARFLRPLARGVWLARVLIACDRLCSRLPLIRQMTFGVIGRAQA